MAEVFYQAPLPYCEATYQDLRGTKLEYPLRQQIVTSKFAYLTNSPRELLSSRSSMDKILALRK